MPTYDDIIKDAGEKAGVKRANRCRHFNGVMNKTCRAGKRYDDINQQESKGRFGCAMRRVLPAGFKIPFGLHITRETLVSA